MNDHCAKKKHGSLVKEVGFTRVSLILFNFDVNKTNKKNVNVAELTIAKALA